MNDFTVPAPEVPSVQRAPIPPTSPGAGPVSGIYAIRCLANGKVYIGQSGNVRKRLYEHRRVLEHGKHVNPHLQAAFDLEGRQCFSFDVIELASSDALDEREKMWIAMYNSTDRRHGYNLDSGGCFEKVHSAETRKKISSANRGRTFSELTRHKMRLAKLGRKQSADHIEKVAAAHRTPEARLKMSLIKRNPSEETRRRMSVGQKNRFAAARLVDSPALAVDSPALAC